MNTKVAAGVLVVALLAGLPAATCAADAKRARLAVTSRSLSSVSFQKSSRTLEVEFHSGAIYRYYDVPERTYTELLRATSKGRYFSARIRGKHRFERVHAAVP